MTDIAYFAPSTQQWSALMYFRLHYFTMLHCIKAALPNVNKISSPNDINEECVEWKLIYINFVEHMKSIGLLVWHCGYSSSLLKHCFLLWWLFGYPANWITRPWKHFSSGIGGTILIVFSKKKCFSKEAHWSFSWPQLKQNKGV